MRKIYSAFLSLLFLLVWINQSNAQVSNYGFVQSSGTYTPVVGTTVIASGWDDNVASATIPFSFTFNGTAYTSVFVNSNGHITFGTTSPGTTNYTPISSAIGYNGAVSAFGRDLISNTTTIDQATTGSAPNRQFVVQWNNARRYNGGPVTGDVLNFQIILNETSNTIQVVYGTCTATNAAALSSQVGLRGATNADFNNRATTTNWSATTAGVANADACTSTNTIMPASGLTFTWLPPGPCVPGSLNGGTVTGAPAGAVCPGVNFTLSVTGASFGTGLTFLWQSSPDNATWVAASGVNNTATYTGGVVTNTYFRRRMTCGATDAFSTSVQITVTGAATVPFSENFSTYTTVFPPSCWTRNNATFITGQAPSAYGVGTGSARYDFFNAANGTSLDLATFVFTPLPAGYFLIFDHAYATFAGEVDQLQVLYSTDGGTTYTNLATYLGGATGPLNTFGGTGATTAVFAPTAAQWATKVISLPAGTNKVLFRGISAFGNNLFIDNIALSSCAPPTGLTTTALTSTSVTLNWIAPASPPSGGYEWEVRSSGAAGSGAAGLAASGATAAGVVTANVAGLIPNTNYTFYVRSSCGGPDFSVWAAKAFATPCATIGIPFIETFATYATTFPPACWTRNNVTFLTGQAPSGYGVGTGSARFDFFTAANGTALDLVSPVFTAVNNSYFLVFDHAYATFAGEVDQLQVLYSTDGGGTYTNLITYAGGTAGPLNTGGATFGVFSPTAAQWKTKIIALPSGTNRVLFRGVSAFGNNLFLDNIAVSSCLPPTGLTATALTPTSATLNWIASTSSPSGGYQWEVRTAGAPGSGAAGLAASGTVAAGVVTANATGLTPNTNYTFYVRSDCGSSDLSIWAAATFLTPCNPIGIPFIETFSSYATTFPPTCWTRNDITFLTGQAPSAYGVGTGSAKFDFYNSPAGTILNLTSPTFTTVTAGYFLVFDHAYATFAGENDQLQILYSTNGGSTYTNLTTYNGGTGGPLNTAGAVLPAFSPTAIQWATKFIALPAGTNRLIFRGVSAFGNNLFLDNILITSCVPPTNLGLSAISPTTATLSWTASSSNPASYQWEVRTAGPAGSGAVGLTASGTSATTSANVTGLTPNTTYTYYVRSVCSVTDQSIWVGYTFATPCNPIAIPFVENFATYAITFPPTCWTRNDATFLTGQAPSAYGIGLGSAMFDFYNAAAGTQLNLISPLFAPTPAGWGLSFDHAYATFAGEVDSLRIMYSTNGGGSYSFLTTYAGGGGGPLNTGGGVFTPFTPAAGQWGTKAIALPAGTNRLLFKGVSAFGNDLFLDNIAIVSCLPPNNVSATGISPTEVLVNFTAPAGSYIIEYGAPGFTPGTGSTAGVGGTIVPAAGSPVIVSPLTPSTTYDFYVRRVCSPTDFSINVKATATTLCPATNIPYLQNFESATVPAMPTCTSKQDVNGNSGSFWLGTGGGSWETYTDANPLTYVSPSKALLYFYDFNDLSRGGDDWFYLQGLNLTGGTSYRLKFFYKALDGANFPEKLEVKYGTRANAADMTTGTLFTNNNISSVYGNSTFDSVRVDFTPPSTGVFYIGFHAMSDPDEFGILMDDISVKIAPLVDVGVTGITLPSINCPTSGIFVQATVTNFNTTTVNFATYPVTVTASITGPAGPPPITVSTVLNAGTLAPGASMSVYLSPAYNFSIGGLYTINATTISPFDPETANDAYSTSVNVNPNPATPVITPPSASICIGNPVLLSTQFAASPPPVTLPAVSSGAISVAVPDNSPAGISHTLAVNSVPVGATVTGVSVTLNMTHTWIGDMIINLQGPNGKVLNLFNQRGANGDNLLNTVITSAAGAPSLGTGAAPFTGTFAPDANAANPPAAYPQSVTGFGGLYSQGNGSWTLALRDNAGLDFGTLTSWSITITYQIVTPTITWTPVAGLYTNAPATTAYTGGNAYSLYANPAATTTYTVTATTPAGCTASATATVTVNPYPVITIGSIPDTVCISDPIIPLAVTPVGGAWTGIGVSGTNFIPPATAVGTYILTYTYTNQFGCTSTATKKIVVKDCPERIILLRDNAVILYPNPNSGQFFIRINSVLYNNLTMRVYANNGTLVRTQQLAGLAWGKIVPIDLNSLSGGLYMVKFYYDGGVRTAEKSFKVVIQHN